MSTSCILGLQASATTTSQVCVHKPKALCTLGEHSANWAASQPCTHFLACVSVAVSLQLLTYRFSSFDAPVVPSTTPFFPTSNKVFMRHGAGALRETKVSIGSRVHLPSSSRQNLPAHLDPKKGWGFLPCLLQLWGKRTA